MVVVALHWPGFGVKVYVPETVLLTEAGDQVPVILLPEVNGNTGAGEPGQIGAGVTNVGVVNGSIVTFNVVGLAQNVTSGVNVYVVVPITSCIVAGDHVPVTPSFDSVGNAGKVDPVQKLGNGSNVELM
jgi:hypothetical protein